MSAALVSADVLVTGSGGFLGTAVVRTLRARGLSVAACVRRLQDGADDGTVLLDIQDESSVRAAFERVRPRAVVHLASSMDVTGENPALIVDANVRGSLALLEASLEHGVERFVYGSSIMVYGPRSLAAGATSVDESSPTDPRSLYGAAKVFVERLAAEQRYTARMQTAGLRFTTIYGPTRLRRGACAFAVDAFEAPTLDRPVAVNREQRSDFIHVDDAAAAVVCALEAPSVDGVYNIGHHEVSGASVAAAVERVRPGTRFELVEGPSSAWPSAVSSDRARAALAWTPVHSVESGAEDTIRWFEESHGGA